MHFRHHDNLRSFIIVARNASFSAAACELNLTKGAISHQIRNLENELGFQLFTRLPGGISLTDKGQKLLSTCEQSFTEIEAAIVQLRGAEDRFVTLAVSTYFASRWLSSRLMTFMNSHPSIRLRIQPMVDLLDLGNEAVDLAIRWGNGNWTDMKSELLFPCPAFVTGAIGTNREITRNGFSLQTLLKDREGSTAWEDWHRVAGIPYEPKGDTLVIPDPNVRVQAVMDGQGIALNDALVSAELEAGLLEQVMDQRLEDYGYYLAFMPGTKTNASVMKFANWLLQQGMEYQHNDPGNSIKP